MDKKNIIVRTILYGSEPRVSFSREDAAGRCDYLTFYFKGKRPSPGKILLIKNLGGFETQSERKIYTLKEGEWRKATLDDFINLENVIQESTFYANDYTPKEFYDFIEKHEREYIETIKTFLKEFKNFKGPEIWPGFPETLTQALGLLIRYYARGGCRENPGESFLKSKHFS